MIMSSKQLYLFRQEHWVFGGKGLLDDEYFTYFVDESVNVEEYIDSIYHYMDTEYGVEWRAEPFEYDFEVSNPEEYGYEPYRGLDGYAMTVTPFDAVVCLGPISEEEIDILKKFKILG